MSQLLKTADVARWLNVHPATLVRLRQRGDGPRVVWLTSNCPHYHATDVEAWLKAQAA